MSPPPLSSLLFLLLLILPATLAEVTVWYAPGQVVLGSSGSTTGAPTATYTAAAAYDTVSLTPPAIPSPAPSTAFFLQLLSTGTQGLSIKQSGAFAGFSVSRDASYSLGFLCLC